MQPDMLVLLGDLNYRINGIKDSIVQAMSKNMFDVLYQNDQLYIERQLGNVPKYFHEGKIEFAPTFKRKPGDNNAFGMKRNPAWTDRILYSCSCSKEACRLLLKSYDSNNLVTRSDHRPVYAQFTYKLELSTLESDDEHYSINPILRSVAADKLKKEYRENNNNNNNDRKNRSQRQIGVKTINSLSQD